ncbi:MAG: RagB/SusD family nutrient uptake outer membrane protein [Paludibacter sp.]|nr:RagB/SusD family nutrient uptake outer membrane protein [Paludibacter sp.]MDD4198409.1 RagB/SusD family nutrient uptake outer membrane protein [Paludibacter sp.]MDD4427087.1 RagB/SusD family nutrient uptake outer membrane protein [Paludibacter sp.]
MKKIQYITSLLYVTIALILTGCFDLDKFPEGELSSTNALSSNSEMEKYLNQFYESAVKTQPGGLASAVGIAFGDQRSDNMVNASPNVRLSGLTTLSDASTLSQYNYIRNLNFFLANVDNNKEEGPEKKHLIGEAYYFRAWYYFQLVKNYGDVAWVSKELNMNEASQPRESRLVIIDHILNDLDLAISFLKEVNSNVSMRVHRDVARIFKSEVALFEATWQKYHKAKIDPFYSKEVTDIKIKSYFEQARDAAKAVIDRGVWNIHSSGEKPYQNMFINLDLTSNKEILWWKKYNAAENIGHSVTRYINEGGGQTGISQSLIDDYLSVDGKIFTGVERSDAQKIYGKELSPDLRDPRLSQTVCWSGTQLKPDGLKYSFPPLHVTTYHQNTTGYSLLKFNEYNTTYAASVTGEFKAQVPAIQYRYAEALLTYAEALAELDGAGNQELIKAALKPLRDRVGMPGVDFDREYNNDPAYPFYNLNKYIQVVRRERRVELACEGFRFDDIMRWAAADELIVGKRPLGALYTGSTLQEQNAPGGYYNGVLKIGSNIQINDQGYIDPYKTVLPNGFGFKVGRDYLLPIQERMLTLTDNLWQQNPGWQK